MAGQDDLDDLLDEALDAFTTQPTSQNICPPSDSGSASFDPLAKNTSSSSNPPKKGKGLAFDPLARPTSTAAAPRTDSAAPFSKFDLPGVTPGQPGVDSITQGLEQLFAEFAKAEGAAQGAGNQPQRQDIAATLAALAEKTRGAGGEVCVDDEDDDLPPELAALAEGGAGVQGLVDSIMQQLLSKEVLYQPMKDIGSRYPEWLASNRERLSSDDYQRYSRQYEYIQQICGVYDSQPDNYVQLMALLQQMQQCGQPPADIVEDLAPGLEFDEEGLPKVAAGTAALPGLPPHLGNCAMQ